MIEQHNHVVNGRYIRAALAGVFVFAGVASPLHAQWLHENIWSDISKSSISILPNQPAPAGRVRTVSLNAPALKQLLATAPLEFTEQARASTIELALPMPDGTNEKFLISESPIMEAGLAARVPESKTYRGQGIDNPATTTRFSWTPAGFRAVVLAPRGATSIEPSADKPNYISYYTSDFNAALAETKCETIADAVEFSSPVSAQFTSGTQMRTYRLALGASGEFTRQYGGSNFMTAPTNALNNMIIPLVKGINAVYEKEVAIHFNLVANELTIIFTDSTTDPYDNSNQNTMLGQNTAALNTAIGSANYDIGHALGGIWLGPGSYSGTGVASLGVVCNTSFKGNGATRMGGGSGTEVIFISLIAHEWGHQFNAPHTFNGTTGNCNGQRSSSDAYEPGSGSTLMGYTTCGDENLEGYGLSTFPTIFHNGSLTRINAYVAAFGTCATTTATGNTPPTISALSNYTVPQQTPFTLTAAATDPNPDVLTYSWEEFDLGTASPPNTDDGSRPIFRVYLPSASGKVRNFPSLTYILNNANNPPATYVNGNTYTTGEALATTNRTMNFHVTVRDNRAGGGGVQDAAMQVTVTTSSGPLAVTSPNTAVTWSGNSQQTITWNVANTNTAPVSCANVMISLSTDGGLTFPTLVTASTPNDGSELLTIPNAAITTTLARIKVEAVGNIFFDVSDVNFTLTHTVPIQLSSFTGTLVGNGVKLDWSTASEINNYGFYVERRGSAQGQFTELSNSFRAGNGTSGSPHNYTFTDVGAPAGTQFYRLKQVDLDTSTHFSDPIQVNVVTSVEEENAPKAFSLEQNYPNPFNPSTTIQFTIVNQQSTTVKLYDLLGRDVATLVNEVKQPGTYTIHFDGTGLASGVYVYRLTAGSFTQSRTMILMK